MDPWAIVRNELLAHGYCPYSVDGSQVEGLSAHACSYELADGRRLDLTYVSNRPMIHAVLHSREKDAEKKVVRCAAYVRDDDLGELEQIAQLLAAAQRLPAPATPLSAGLPARVQQRSFDFS